MTPSHDAWRTSRESSWKLKVSRADFNSLNRQLIGYFRRRVPQHDAKDLAADTWVCIARCYQGRCSVRSFAFIIAANIVIDVRRKRRIIITSLLDYEDVAAEGPGPDSLLMSLVGGFTAPSPWRLRSHGAPPLRSGIALRVP